MALIRKELPTPTMKKIQLIWEQKYQPRRKELSMMIDLNFQNPVLAKRILTFYPHHRYLQSNQAPSQYRQLIPLIKGKYDIVPSRTYS